MTKRRFNRMQALLCAQFSEVWVKIEERGQEMQESSISAISCARKYVPVLELENFETNLKEKGDSVKNMHVVRFTVTCIT